MRFELHIVCVSTNFCLKVIEPSARKIFIFGLLTKEKSGGEWAENWIWWSNLSCFLWFIKNEIVWSLLSLVWILLSLVWTLLVTTSSSLPPPPATILTSKSPATANSSPQTPTCLLCAEIQCKSWYQKYLLYKISYMSNPIILW